MKKMLEQATKQLKDKREQWRQAEHRTMNTGEKMVKRTEAV
jgi:hypothetical protein